MKKNIIQCVLALTVAASSFSCKREEAETVVKAPEKVNEAEEIAKVQLNIKDDAGKVSSVSYLVGDKTNPVIKLAKDKTYSFDLQIFKSDKSESTKEIIEEKEEHFFVYEFADITAKLLRASNDEQRKDLSKIGLRTTLMISDAPKATSIMKVKLLHKPTSVTTKSATDERGSAVGGATDFDITFNIEAL